MEVEEMPPRHNSQVLHALDWYRDKEENLGFSARFYT
jgi:hypothetical protein